MVGFDPQFNDLCDYILKITYWIWEGKQPELCADYYSQDCPVYTLSGITIGAEEVIENTAKTQAAFPDRTLDAANIIWGGNAEEGFHSSHLIDTQMTAMGESEFGSASGRSARGFVIAHCICKDNRIIEEWLVRDNYLLAIQFGKNPLELVNTFAATPEPARLQQWRTSELTRLNQNPAGNVVLSSELSPATNAFLSLLHSVWKQPSASLINELYAADAIMNVPKGETLSDATAILSFYDELHEALSGITVMFDYACNNSYNTDGDYLAVRWTLSGQHTGGTLFGEPVNQPLLIIGESHYRFNNGKIVEEWCMYDLLGVLVQVERLRNAQSR